MLEKIVNFLNEYGFEIAWFVMGFMFNEFLIDVTRENLSGAFFDLFVILFMMWSVKENYE